MELQPIPHSNAVLHPTNAKMSELLMLCPSFVILDSGFLKKHMRCFIIADNVDMACGKTWQWQYNKSTRWGLLEPAKVKRRINKHINEVQVMLKVRIFEVWIGSDGLAWSAGCHARCECRLRAADTPSMSTATKSTVAKPFTTLLHWPIRVSIVYLKLA
jgi:hypothetical protein